MKTNKKELQTQLEEFDWDAHQKALVTFDDSHIIEIGMPHGTPMNEVGNRARQIGDRMLSILQLDLTTDDIEAFFDSPYLEDDLEGIFDDEKLFNRVQEILTAVFDQWETIFEDPIALIEEEKQSLVERLWEIVLVDSRVVENYQTYLDELDA
jgi:hypothetical protein